MTREEWNLILDVAAEAAWNATRELRRNADMDVGAVASQAVRALKTGAPPRTDGEGGATLRQALSSILVFAIDWEEVGAIAGWPQIEWQRALARIAELARAALAAPAAPAPRTVEEERADVVAYLQRKARDGDAEEAHEWSDACLTLVSLIGGGAHVGAAARRAKDDGP